MDHLSLWPTANVTPDLRNYLPRRRASTPFDQHQFIPYNDRRTCVSNLLQGHYPTAEWTGVEPATSKPQLQRLTSPVELRSVVSTSRCVCLYICQRAYLRNHTSKFFYVCCFRPSSGGVVIRYVLPFFVDDVMFTHNWRHK